MQRKKKEGPVSVHRDKEREIRRKKSEPTMTPEPQQNEMESISREGNWQPSHLEEERKK